MNRLSSWTFSCPACGYRDSGDKFDPSLADECVCPACGERFNFESTDEDDEDHTGNEVEIEFLVVSVPPKTKGRRKDTDKR